MDCTTDKLKRGKKRKGETLVETIVSFSIIMIMLALVGTVLMAAIRMTQYSAEQAVRLEAACEDVENHPAGTAATGQATMTINVKDMSNQPLGTATVELDIFQSENGLLTYFKKAPGEGGS